MSTKRKWIYLTFTRCGSGYLWHTLLLTGHLVWDFLEWCLGLSSWWSLNVSHCNISKSHSYCGRKVKHNLLLILQMECGSWPNSICLIVLSLLGGSSGWVKAMNTCFELNTSKPHNRQSNTVLCVCNICCKVIRWGCSQRTAGSKVMSKVRPVRGQVQYCLYLNYSVFTAVLHSVVKIKTKRNDFAKVYLTLLLSWFLDLIL